jgi:hypothetical protein
LVAGQRVTIDLDGEKEVVDAMTTSGGEARVLAQVRRASPRAVARRVAGVPAVLLQGSTDRTSRGRANQRGDAALDGIRRRRRRAAAGATYRGARRGRHRATIASLDPGPASQPLSTFTVNISATGALLKRPPAAPQTGDVALELFFGADPTPVPARGPIVRTTDDRLAVTSTTSRPPSGSV